MRHIEHVMGTAVTIDLPDDTPIELLVDAIERLHSIEDRFSVFRPESQISRIGRGALSIDAADSDVQSVLATCGELYVSTLGAFSHWQGGRDRPLDPNGYVKGWAVDRVGQLFNEAGVHRYFINAGGDTLAYSESDPWRIGVRHPTIGEALGAVLESNNLAVATSGSYERGPHIWGVEERQLTSVTVTGPQLGIADAIATALCSIDQSNPEWLRNFPGYEVLTFDRDDGRHRTEHFVLRS